MDGAAVDTLDTGIRAMERLQAAGLRTLITRSWMVIR
jgi:hypothetical protein